MQCRHCQDSGVIETGNNDLPCVCPAGATAMFNVAGVTGLVTGAEVRRHFFNDSPQPIETSLRHPIPALHLPGRN